MGTANGPYTQTDMLYLVPIPHTSYVDCFTMCNNQTYSGKAYEQAS